LSPPLDPCPCCRGKLSASALRAGICSRCLAVVGEANRCGLCHAFMPVVERAGHVSCGACGSPREHHVGTVSVSDAQILQALEPAPVSRRLWLPALTAVAAVGLAAGLGASRTTTLMVAVAGTLFWAVDGFLSLRRQRLAARRRTFEIEQRIIGLAYQNDGVLREDEVSTRLRISLAEARAVLVDLAIQDRAVVHGQGAQPPEFRFGEARRTRAIRRRAPRPPTP
jgi:hypothetical protein